MANIRLLTVVTRCDADELDRLSFNELLHSQRGEELLSRLTRRRKNPEKGGSHPTLILSDEPSH